MLQATRKAIQDWSDTTNDRVKLQHVYLVIAAGLIILAGLLSLLNPQLGHVLVQYSIAALGIFVLNGVIWAVLFSMFYPRTPQPAPRKKR